MDAKKGFDLRRELQGNIGLTLEEELQSLLITAISKRRKYLSEVNTIDSGRMDIVVYDGLGASEHFPPGKHQIPGRPSCLIELKRRTIEDLESVFNQGFRYQKTLIGRHAGLKCLPVVIYNGRFFMVGYAMWSFFSALEFGFCSTKFYLEGPNEDLVLSNYALLDAIIFGPARLRERQIDIYMNDISQKETLEILRVAGYGSGSAVYLASRPNQLEKMGVVEGRPSSVVEKDPILSSSVAIKCFRNYEEFRRELLLLEYLADLENASPCIPVIIGTAWDNQAIAYKTYSLAESTLFWETPTVPLTLNHVRDLFLALELLHQNGISHCDVRLANIAFDGDSPVLLDYGFAQVGPGYGDRISKTEIFPSNSHRYCGTIETASNRILEQLASNPACHIIVRPEDDLESLVKMYQMSRMASREIGRIKEAAASENYAGLLEIWNLDLIVRSIAHMNPADRAEFVRLILGVGSALEN